MWDKKKISPGVGRTGGEHSIEDSDLFKRNYKTSSDENQAPTVLDAALEYARQGWHVFPVHAPVANGTVGCTCKKPQCDNVGKHPIAAFAPKGVKDASRNEQTIRYWFQKRPDANIAIATGSVSGVFVLDVDTKSGGTESLAELEQQFGPLPETRRVITGSGGLHIFFQCPDVQLKNRVGFRPGLDIRADGGYVVAAPSLHASGQRYTWVEGESEIEPAPEWLLDILTQRSERSTPSTELDTPRILAGVPEGERDISLFKIACRLRRADVPYDMAEYLILQAAANCTPPFSEHEARRKVQRVYETYQAQREFFRFLVSSPRKFPVHVFPEPARQYIEEGAESLGIPPEMIAGPFLAAVGGTIGRNYRLHVKQGYAQSRANAKSNGSEPSENTPPHLI